LVSNGWSTWIQYHRECEIETTLENNIKFLYQCSRWARSNWRSNYTSLFTERYVWRQQKWSTYALHIATFTSLSFLFDPLIICLVFQSTSSWSSDEQKLALLTQLVFMGISKVVKLLGLFMREPYDIMYLPVSIMFGYFHGLIKLYALATLRITSWGSRADGDANDSHRMSPRARRSDSITLPPGHHPTLIRYNDEKISLTSEKTSLTSPSPFNEKEALTFEREEDGPPSESNHGSASSSDCDDLFDSADDRYDSDDSDDSYSSNSTVVEIETENSHGR